MKNKRLLESIGYIDEKYIEEAEPKMERTSTSKQILRIAACFAIVIALSLYLFLPFGSGVMDLSAYQSSTYFPLIEAIEDYRYVPPKYDNNFEVIVDKLGNISLNLAPGMMGTNDAVPDNESSVDSPTAPGDVADGNYEEVTDNQVEGVIESDIFKRTDKHIFRITGKTLTVYSIKGEESEKVHELNIPTFGNEYAYNSKYMEMYLSQDGKTITIIKPYTNTDKKSEVGIISLDVSDAVSIKVKSTLSIDGSYNSSRMVDGKMLLISEYYFNAASLDYNKPETYVPSIDKGNGRECIEFEDIIFPENINHTRYSVVALISEDNLDILGASALLNFTSEVYVSQNSVYLTRPYTQTTNDDEFTKTETMTDIAVLEYANGTLKNNGIISVSGSIKDQYSMDEFEGHFRVVTSTNKRVSYTKNSYIFDQSIISSASLYVFDLTDNKLIASVDDFAPQGESAESVRFDGDTAYVCTAIVSTFTDPVYFFNLSDYSNITYTDTGVIEGYSSSLINLKDGFLLGIGREDRTYNKVEVYEESGDSVKSVDVFKFIGNYSEDYKSYMINREENLFGFAVTNYSQDKYDYSNVYILLLFNGYELIPIEMTRFDDCYDASRVRATYIDGYLYITGDIDFKVVNITNN